MKVVILEDESLAAEHLVGILNQLNSQIEVLTVLDSVKSGVIWFLKNDPPDLVFMDIQLGDGLSFEVIDAVDINCPIIFTTAFDEYALKAFKVNSVDYILKPVEKEEVENALNKIENLLKSTIIEKQGAIKAAGEMLSEPYKKRFIVKVGEHIHSLESDKVLFFYSQHKATFIKYSDGKNYLIDHSLDQLAEILSPEKFFRISRKYIVSFESIEDIIQYSNSRLRLKLTFSSEDDIIVSRDRVSDFKNWLDK